MKPYKRLIIMLILAGIWAPAHAGDTSAPTDLPATVAVLKALADHPQVRAAEAQMRMARAERDRLGAGSHEYGLRLVANRRSVTDGPDYNEWEASIERGLRLSGKARLDQRIGALTVEEAEELVGDARHETAKQLLGLWYAALRSQAESRLWGEQVELLRQEQRITLQRQRRGDAARLNTLQADAALAQALSRLGEAQAQAQLAMAELRARFPELPPPAASQAEPMLPAGGEAEWIERTQAHNHELLALQRATEKFRLMAQRAESDRQPDPTLGLRYANERGGDEQVLGVSLSIALPGEGRKAMAAAHAAQAEALSEREAATRRRLAAEASANWQRASGGVDGYRRMREAAEAAARHADLARRAHELGELGLSDVLLARRTALETGVAAEQARLAANEAIARLLLDAHGLWPLGDADHH